MQPFGAHVVLVTSDGFTIADHVPRMVDNSPYCHRGRAHAVGYLHGPVQAVAGIKN